MLFVLSLFSRLNKRHCLNIIDKALLNKIIVIDIEFDTNVLLFSTNIYRKKKIELMLSNINKNVIVYII